MARKEKKYHYIYKTTNLLSGRYYIGMHSTDNLEDGYMGSGKRLRRSLNKYGKENHKVEILEFVDTRKDLKEREEEVVNLNEIAKVDCMNLVVGGTGGFISLEGAKKGGKISSKLTNKIRWEDNREENLEFFNDQLIKWWDCPIIKNKMLNRKGFKDKNHSEETKQKMRKSKNVGSNNSQFGTCWITNGIDNKKISKTSPIPEGWRLGRKIK